MSLTNLGGARRRGVLAALSESPWGSLHQLEISDMHVARREEAATRRALAAALGCMPALDSVQIVHCKWLGNAGVLAIAAAPMLTRLECLTLVGVGLSAADNVAALRALAAARWPRLAHLHLQENNFSSDAAAPALAALHRHALRSLELQHSHLEQEAVEAMAALRWPALERLDLRRAGTPVMLTLAQARRWAPKLEKLLVSAQYRAHMAAMGYHQFQ
jgi:hypothetical protein